MVRADEKRGTGGQSRPRLPGAAVTTPLAVSMDEAARLCGISVRTLWRHVDRGEVTVCRIGRRTVVRISELERWLAAHEERGSAETVSGEGDEGS